MWRLATVFAVVMIVSCTNRECVDCVDNEGNVFTFCDPAESPIDSLACGAVYEDR